MEVVRIALIDLRINFSLACFNSLSKEERLKMFSNIKSNDQILFLNTKANMNKATYTMRFDPRYIPKLMMGAGQVMMVQEDNRLIFIQKDSRICKKETMFSQDLDTQDFYIEDLPSEGNFSLSMNEVIIFQNFLDMSTLVTIKLSNSGMTILYTSQNASLDNSDNILEFGKLGDTYSTASYMTKYLRIILSHVKILKPESVLFNLANNGPMLIYMEAGMFQLTHALSNVTDVVGPITITKPEDKPQENDNEDWRKITTPNFDSILNSQQTSDSDEEEENYDDESDKDSEEESEEEKEWDPEVDD
jgi:hypothetical protein